MPVDFLMAFGELFTKSQRNISDFEVTPWFIINFTTKAFQFDD
jgi:hypothetical protein